ncbi:resuscitation-promoting factor [Nocardioides sp. SOB77]|uniref:Resuscitation-promoting factor n=1 Tax=Nocardioides oceani TaxID=3058369 RepID=A0ABT8FIZ7_9ACTN|nr:resuscitation-promoting factor [Nocardioides oceani]MDN4174652.1 resuscitation-promoting factor [Nocardioides oceani]
MPSLQSVPSLLPGRPSLRAATSGLMTAVVLALLPAPASAEDQVDAPTPAPVTSTDSTSDTTVRLRVGSRGTRSLRTSADWAAGLLREQGVRVSRRDQVRVVRDDRRVAGDRRRLRGGDTVKVVRVDREVTSRRVRLRAGVEERRTTSLRPGQRRVVRDGRPGVRRVRVIRVTHNERVVRRAVRKDVLREPRPRRVLVGAARRSVPGADHLDWRALARCESGGDPRAVNPAGYYGLYQFDVSTWRSVGGGGMPHRASAGEQTYRAKLLYGQRGRSPWPHCGRHL